MVGRGHHAAPVLATGLLNPRGVSVGLDGTVYVAESGVGGATRKTAQIEGEPSSVCVGDSGGVTRVRRGQAQRIATFASFTEAAELDDGSPSCDPTMIGFATTGPSDVAARLDGSVSVTTGLGGNGEVRSALGEFVDQFGKLFDVDRRGGVSEIADITGYEDVANPDQAEDGLGEVDSNPYGVTSFLGYHFVADAGGNDIRVHRRGRVSTLTTFPMVQGTTVPTLSCGNPPPPDFPPAGAPIPAQPVPTSVTIGSDGNIYAGQLTGFPFNTGVANIWKINPITGQKRVYASGLTNVVGVAASLDGSLYVVEIARNGLLEGEICGNLAGRLVKISRNGTQTEIPVPGGLTAPGGVAVGLDGTVYVTNNSIQPGGAGQLLAIRPG